ncbi:MAG: class D sortase [Bryobacteraceae bacterium]
MKPSLTIRPHQQGYFIKPGLHSHNSTRRIDRHPSRHRVVRFVRAALFLIGLWGIAYYGYTLSDEYIYQAYENWAFDQKITGRQVTFTDYVRERTPFGFLTLGLTSTPKLVTTGSTQSDNVQPSKILRPVTGSVLGRVQIARLNLSAIVREGVDEKTLSRAVGHLPYTALFGQIGNFAIAAHRDTLFRALKDIQKDDRITFQSPVGTYTYEVTSTKIVKPSDLSVVQPQGTDKLLTMITCYPFYYIGSAPKRFIVQSRLVESNQNFAGESRALGSVHSTNSRSSHPSTPSQTPRIRSKKLGFRRKLLHRKQS